MSGNENILGEWIFLIFMLIIYWTLLKLELLKEDHKQLLIENVFINEGSKKRSGTYGNEKSNT
jgi:hypothetical protein